MPTSVTACERNPRYTKRDALVGAGVMVGVSAVLALLGIAARRTGFPLVADVLLQVSFPGSLTLSMPFWAMKGLPWRVQAAIVGGTLAILVAIAVITSRL